VEKKTGRKTELCNSTQDPQRMFVTQMGANLLFSKGHGWDSLREREREATII